MNDQAVVSSLPLSSSIPVVSPKGLMRWLTAARSRYVLLQSLVGIALSYELLFGNETVVSRWVAELTVVGLLITILAIVAIPGRFLDRPWFVNALVGLDTLMTALSVYVAGNAREEFYLAYFLLILIATSARTLGQVLGLSAVVCAGYGLLVAEGLLTTGELSAGQLMGVPVLLMMGVFYGLTLDELGAERRRGEGLSHRLAELRLEEERLLLTRDRLLHETTALKSALAQRAQREASVAEIGTSHSARQCRKDAPGEVGRRHMERLAVQVAAMLQDLAGQMGRETGALRSGMKPDHPLNKHLEQVLLAGERTATVAVQLQALAQHDPVTREVCSLNATLAELEPIIRDMLPDDISLGMDLCLEGAFVQAEPGMLEQIVLQLVMNARESMPSGGHLVLAIRSIDQETVEEARRPGSVHLVVRDTSRGMDPETQARLLEPFFTTKPRGGAWGMGLTTVQSTVARLGGTLTIASQPGRGTEVTVAWPRVDAGGLPRTVTQLDARLCGNGGETVLVVEEDEGHRKWMVAALRRARYQVLEAQSGVQAMLLAHQYPGTIHLILSNLIMPEMSGVELAERLFSERPTLKAVFTSSFPEHAVKAHRISPRCYLQKPFRQDELLRKVRDSLDVS